MKWMNLEFGPEFELRERTQMNSECQSHVRLCKNAKAKCQFQAPATEYQCQFQKPRVSMPNAKFKCQSHMQTRQSQMPKPDAPMPNANDSDRPQKKPTGDRELKPLNNTIYL